MRYKVITTPEAAYGHYNDKLLPRPSIRTREFFYAL